MLKTPHLFLLCFQSHVPIINQLLSFLLLFFLVQVLDIQSLRFHVINSTYDKLESIRPTPACSCSLICSSSFSLYVQKFKYFEYITCFLKGLNNILFLLSTTLIQWLFSKILSLMQFLHLLLFIPLFLLRIQTSPKITPTTIKAGEKAYGYQGTSCSAVTIAKKKNSHSWKLLFQTWISPRVQDKRPTPSRFQRWSQERQSQALHIWYTYHQQGRLQISHQSSKNL